MRAFRDVLMHSGFAADNGRNGAWGAMHHGNRMCSE